MALASHMGEYFGKTLVLEQWGYENCQTHMGVKKVEFPAGIAYLRVPCSGWFSPSRVEFRELVA